MKKVIAFLLLFLSACSGGGSKPWIHPAGFPTEHGKLFIIGVNFPYYGINPDLVKNSGDSIYWRELLFQIKSSGFNTIYIRVPWGFHEQSPGTRDFIDGAKNLRGLLQLAESYGLKIILDISPQSNDMYNGGGIPLWFKRFLTYTPSNDIDGKVALRTTDKDFLNQYDSYLQNLLNLIYPYLWLPNYKSRPIIALILEKNLLRLHYLWQETLSFLNLNINPLNGYKYKLKNLDAVKGLSTPVLFEDSDTLADIIRSKRVLSPRRFHRLTISDLTLTSPYEILNAYVSGDNGIIFENFVSHYFSANEAGWQRGGYPENASSVSTTGDFIKEELSLSSPLSVTGAEASLVAKWLTQGYFPTNCIIKKWEITNNFPISSSEQNFTVQRAWFCKNNLLSVSYKDPGSLVVSTIDPTFPYIQLKDCKVLFAGKEEKLLYFILEDTQGCFLYTNNKVEITPQYATWGESKHLLRFHSDALIKITNSKKEIQIYGFTPERLPFIHPVNTNYITSGFSYAEISGNTLHILSNTSGSLIKPDIPYPKTITYSTMSTNSTSITFSRTYYLNESLNNERYNPTYNTSNWIEGKAFESYFTDSPYNYESGVFWTVIPFKNNYGGNGYIKLPSLSGSFNIFLNGNFLGTYTNYGNDTTVPFKATQIKISTNNYLTLMGLPLPSFPMEDPLYISESSNEYLTLFNFYHKTGSVGEALIKVGNHIATFNGNWYYISGLWGERHKLFSNIINEKWRKISLPIKIKAGDIIWLKNFFKYPINPSSKRFTISISVSGKNFIALVYFNTRYRGFLLPSPYKTTPLSLQITSKKIIIEPEIVKENNLTLALISINGTGEIEKIKINISKPQVEQWISLH